MDAKHVPSIITKWLIFGDSTRSSVVLKRLDNVLNVDSVFLMKVYLSGMDF